MIERPTARNQLLRASIQMSMNSPSLPITKRFISRRKNAGAGRTFVFSLSTMAKPAEIYRANIDGSGITALTTTNDALLAPFKLNAAEEITWTGGMGANVMGWIVKPAN